MISHGMICLHIPQGIFRCTRMCTTAHWQWDAKHHHQQYPGWLWCGVLGWSYQPHPLRWFLGNVPPQPEPLRSISQMAVLVAEHRPDPEPVCGAINRNGAHGGLGSMCFTYHRHFPHHHKHHHHHPIISIITIIQSSTSSTSSSSASSSSSSSP